MILHMCACVCFREQKVYPSSLRQLGMAIQTLPGLALLHSCWLGDTFSLWLFCTCGLAVTRAVKRLGSGLPWLRGLVKDADPTKPGTCKAVPVPSTGASSTDFIALDRWKPRVTQRAFLRKACAEPTGR